MSAPFHRFYVSRSLSHAKTTLMHPGSRGVSLCMRDDIMFSCIDAAPMTRMNDGPDVVHHR